MATANATLRTAEDWMREGKSETSAKLHARLGWQCRVNELMRGTPRPASQFGVLSTEESAASDLAYANGKTPELFVAFVKANRAATAPRCAGTTYDRRFRMRMACSNPATVEREGALYCVDCDPEGRLMQQQNRDDWVRATAKAADKHRVDAAERLADAEVECARLIEGHAFRYRDELYAFLHEARKAEKGSALTESEKAMLRAVAIPLWGSYARANRLDVRMVSLGQYEQVARATALKAKQSVEATR